MLEKQKRNRSPQKGLKRNTPASGHHNLFCPSPHVVVVIVVISRIEILLLLVIVVVATGVALPTIVDCLLTATRTRPLSTRVVVVHALVPFIALLRCILLLPLCLRLRFWLRLRPLLLILLLFKY